MSVTNTNTCVKVSSKGDLMWLKRSAHTKQTAVSKMLCISLRHHFILLTINRESNIPTYASSEAV